MIRPLRYTIRFPLAGSCIEVDGRIPLGGQQEVELFLPVWTPGSYLIREYARHVEGLTAVGPGQDALAVVKTRKNRWLVKSDYPLDEITIRYRLYCNDLTVRTNFVDDSMVILHGAATFINVAGRGAGPYEVKVELPAAWKECWSGMEGDAAIFRASDYDCLVDSPIVAGNPSSYSFTIDGKPHIWLNFGDFSYWDYAQALEALRQIVVEHQAMWGELPYDQYLFFNLLTGGRGALEHRNCMVLMADRFTMRTRKAYAAWLELVSHEFFHVWNAKRLRPVELGPFDYENEAYTTNLWITEGFTEYYGPLAVRRANLTTVDEFLATLSHWIQELQTAPGRLRQPVAMSSFDAWIKLYRPDENSRNSSISYYTKGAVIAWLLDARIRCETGGGRSLDDAMRLALGRHGGLRGFTTADFIEVVEEVAGVELEDWIRRVTDTTEELEYAEALAWFGLRFRAAAETLDAKAWIGCKTKVEANRLMVSEVLRGTPAFAAGILPGDEILGAGGYRVLAEKWGATIEQFRVGETVALLVSRRERILSVPVRLEAEPALQWAVEIDPAASAEQRAHLREWQKGTD